MLASTALRHGKKDELPSKVSDSKMAQNCSRMMKLCNAQVSCEGIAVQSDQTWKENSKCKQKADNWQQTVEIC